MKYLITSVKCYNEYYDEFPSHALVTEHDIDEFKKAKNHLENIKSDFTTIESISLSNDVLLIDGSELEDLLTEDEMDKVEEGDNIWVELDEYKIDNPFRTEFGMIAEVNTSWFQWKFTPKHTNFICETTPIYFKEQ